MIEFYSLIIKIFSTHKAGNVESGLSDARPNELNESNSRIRYALFCDRANGAAAATVPIAEPAAVAAE